MKMVDMKTMAWLMLVHTTKPDRSRICTDSIEPGHTNTYSSVKNNVAPYIYAVSLAARNLPSLRFCDGLSFLLLSMPISSLKAVSHDYQCHSFSTSALLIDFLVARVTIVQTTLPDRWIHEITHQYGEVLPCITSCDQQLKK